MPNEFLPPHDTAGRFGIGVSMATAAHVLLVLALAWGVSWNSKAPDGVQAELWSAVPQVAAPPAPALEPVRPTPTKPTKPVTEHESPRPPRETAPARPTEQELRNAQLAIEKVRRELEARAEKKRKDSELDRLKLREKEREQEREKEHEKEREKEREKEHERARELEKKKVEAEKKKTDERQQKEQLEKIEANRLKNLKRLQDQAGAGAETSTGTAARTSGGISASYAGKVRAAVIPNIINIHSFVGNPTAEVKVTLAPDGRVMSQSITKPSGIADWDDAVLRAIERTKGFPRQEDGTVPPYLILTISPKSL